MTQLNTRFLIAGACCVFILLGIVLIPYAGVQHDEALFSVPLYLFITKELSISILHRRVPLMLMSYVGTLKSLLYLPIFAVARPTPWSVRLPMVLTGALTVFFFCRLCLRSFGPAVAITAALLLATDPIFLVTDTFDWGPVAIEHLLLVTGCFCLVRFAQKNTLRDLALGFFLLGLGLWNKAIFVWALAGLGTATIVVFWAQVRRMLRPRNAVWAVAAFLLGASPFVLYNIRRPNDTLRSNASLETVNIFLKLPALRVTLDGSGLLGFITAPERADAIKVPSTRGGRVALRIARLFGEHNRNGMEYAFLLALLAVPLWWRSPPARFSLVFLIVTWLAMAITKDAGGSLHHTILLWPFPILFVAATLAELPWRRIAIGAGALLIALNLLVVNQYLLGFARNGAWNGFTDAIFPLSGMFTGHREPIYIVDWGMLNALAMFHQGRLTLRAADAPFSTDTPGPNDQRDIAIIFSIPYAVYVGHVPAREVNTGSTERLERAAAALDYRKEILRIIPDSNGRPVFEVFRIVKAGP